MQAVLFRFGVIMMDYESDATGFAGLIALDTKGYVVWYHDVGFHMGPFDQLSSYDVVSMSFPGNGFMEVEKGSSGNDELLTSLMMEMTPTGSYVHTYKAECGGGPMEYATVTHEAHIDTCARSHMSAGSHRCFGKSAGACTYSS